MVFAAVAATLAFAALCPFLARPGGRERARAAHPATPAPRRAAFCLVLLGVEVTDNAFLVDGVLTEADDELGPAGWPVTVKAPRSTTPSLDAWMHSLLERWVADDVPVRFTLKGEDSRRRASITDGSSTLHFSADA